jgi:hypothetical protein
MLMSSGHGEHMLNLKKVDEMDLYIYSVIVKLNSYYFRLENIFLMVEQTTYSKSGFTDLCFHNVLKN